MTAPTTIQYCCAMCGARIKVKMEDIVDVPEKIIGKFPTKWLLHKACSKKAGAQKVIDMLKGRL